MKDRVSDKPRGFGFVTFEEEAVADKVCEERHELQGRQVRPERSCHTWLQRILLAFSASSQNHLHNIFVWLQIDAKRSVPPQQQPRSKKVFVGGLAPATKEGKF